MERLFEFVLDTWDLYSSFLQCKIILDETAQTCSDLIILSLPVPQLFFSLEILYY